MEDFFAKCFQVEDEDDDDDILPITKVIKGGKIKSQTWKPKNCFKDILIPEKDFQINSTIYLRLW